MEIYFARGEKSSDFESKDYIHINNFGYYKNILKTVCTARINGRCDYQIIYVLRGRMNVKIKDENCVLKDGDAVIFYPGEKQIYSFEKEKNSCYFWIHFSGHGAKDLLEGLNLPAGIYHTGGFFRFSAAFSEMKEAFSVCRFSAEVNVLGIFLSLLSEFSKKINLPGNEISKAIELMGANKIYTNAYLAELCLMSEYHFIRKFKEYMGTTPHRYQMETSVKKAARMLEDTNLRIGEIADAVGFRDQMYFGRMFKSIMNISPTEFRKLYKIT